jgi:UDP-glucose 4-epimerase
MAPIGGERRKRVRVLVTGGAGFIGAHVTNALVRAGHAPVVVDRLDRGPSPYLPPDVPLIVEDVRHVDAVVKAVGPVDAVVHLAARISVPEGEENPLPLVEDNVAGTMAALVVAERLGAREFRFASTAAVYGDPRGRLPLAERRRLRPESFYGLSKQAAEDLVRHFAQTRGMAAVILRLANVYGPGQTASGEGGVVAQFCDRLGRNLPLRRHGDGEQTRDFLYVADAARAFVHRLGEGTQGTYNVGTGTATSVNHLGALLAACAGRPLAWEDAPPRPGDVRASVFDVRLSRRWGYTAAVTLEEGLARTWEAWTR